MSTKSLEKSKFYSKLFKLVLPIAIQNLLSAAISSADVIMLNYVGQTSISAVSLASQYASILFSLLFGLGTGVTLLCAQYYGKGDMDAIRIVQGIALRFSLIGSLLFAVPALLIPEQMMYVFTDEAELIEIGASYLRFMGISYICWSIVEVYFAALRSIGRVTICTVLNVIAFVVNILLNATFIFGLFGAPKLGAAGVAIATSVSRLVELAGCLIVSHHSKDIKLSFRSIFVKNKVLFKDFIKFSTPALGNDIIWGLAFSMYAVIIGHLGSDAVAANSFVVVVRNFGTILCFGVANAGTIMIGNTLGENKLEEAKTDAGRLLKLAFITGAIGGLLVLASMPLVLSYASESLTDTAMYYLKWMLLINTYYISGAAVNTMLIGGVFRAGGDTKFGLICDTIDMWCYAVPLGLIAAFVLELPVLVVYFLLCTDEFVKWPWVFKHYKSGKWIKNITREDIY